MKQSSDGGLSHHRKMEYRNGPQKDWQTPPKAGEPRHLWQKINLDFTSIRTGKSRLRKRNASWPSRKKSAKPPPPLRPESCPEPPAHRRQLLLRQVPDRQARQDKRGVAPSAASAKFPRQV